MKFKINHNKCTVQTDCSIIMVYINRRKQLYYTLQTILKFSYFTQNRLKRFQDR